jgi:2-amino-4-hydroxy-6-hydroxymethyldihydropteridine diphosphokinase
MPEQPLSPDCSAGGERCFSDAGPADRLAVVGLGSNLPSDRGNPAETVRAALRALESLSQRPMVVSSLWESVPIDCPPGSPLFINAVAVLMPAPIDAEEFLRELQHIEQDFGRFQQPVQNAPRPLDLDLLAYGREVCASATLTLPHPRAFRREFVLRPLLEIAEDFIFPGQNLTIRELLQALPTQAATGVVSRLG